MKQFFVTFAGVVAGLLFFFVVLPFALILSMAASAAGETKPTKPTVLELDLRDGVRDQEPSTAFSFFADRGLSVMRIIQTLRHAEKDDRIKAVLVRLPEAGMPPAAADELRLAFRHFRAAGKPILAHSQGLYASGQVVSTYQLGAAAGEIWMQPDTAFQATGATSTELFLKRAFDKYGVKAEYEQRYEYKNAVNQYLYDDYTPAHREATLSWMSSVYDTALSQAAADRKIAAPALKAIIEAGPYSAEQARAKGLIDRLGQVREAEEALKKRAGGDAEIIDFSDYAVATRSAVMGGPTIAVIGAEGAIETGRGQASPFGGRDSVYSDDTADAFYDAIEDDSVKAIVFRVSSPGGSDSASEQIRAALRAAKAAGKPVVVSMGAYAASGGYWVSADASSIVANPSTLTGSIGVFGGKFVFSDALARFGLDSRQLSVGGDYASAETSVQPFTNSQRAAYSAWIDHIYDAFVQRVAQARRLPEARVREIAKGHVWTGAQAKTLGLVDQLGGFYDAVDVAKRLIGLKPEDEVRLRAFPAERTGFAALSRALGISETSVRALAFAGSVLGDKRAQSVMDDLVEARLRADGKASVLAPTPLPTR